jgi:hypothetical protein
MKETASLKKCKILEKIFRQMMKKDILNIIINKIYQKKVWMKNIKFQKVKGLLHLINMKNNNKYI